MRFWSSNVLIVLEYCSIVLVLRARKGYVEASLNGLKCSVRIWVLRVNDPVRYSSSSSRHATVLL
jgi:hypothetical protein